MNLGLETDVNNQNFVGARNPDDALWVKFETRPMPDNVRSQAEGRPIFNDETWIEIRIPGNPHLTIERPKEPSDEIRWPRHWAYYKQTSGEGGEQAGTPIAQWPMLRPSQVEMLKAQKFYTVEQIALASDENIGKLGMSVGMGPLEFRSRAKVFLETSKDSAFASKQQQELEKRDAEMAEMKKQIADLTALLQSATAPAAEPKAKKAA